MGHANRHGYPTLNAFVDARIAAFRATDHTFQALFALMFAEPDTLFYEKSEGWRIVRTTYGQARARLLARAARLRERLDQLPPNAVVGLYLENSLEWIELFWAILLCGWRPLLMNLRLDRDTLEQALAQSGAAAVISAGEVFSVPTLPAGDITPADAPLTVGRTGEEIFVMSSGSSGSVKLCAYGAEEFYQQVNASCDLVRQCAQAKKHWKGHLKHLCFLPFYHIFGLVAVYIWFAFFSCAFVELADLSPQTIVNTIRRHGVTHIFAVPLFWNKVYEQAMASIAQRGEKTAARFRRAMAVAQRLDGVPLLGRAFSKLAFREVRREMFGDSVRFLISGGSHIDPQVLSFFNCIGYPLSNGYGMSEVGITSVELSPKGRVRSSGTVGPPLPTAQYRLTADGELQIRSAAAARYILENGVRREREPWFSTRDLAREEKGRYFILGRMDDVVITPSGENLNPALVEPGLAIPGQAEACVIRTGQGDRVRAVALMSVRGRVTGHRLEELDRAVRQRLSAMKLEGQIGQVVFIADDFLTPQEFKLNRQALARRYEQGRLTVLTPQSCQAIFAQDEGALATQVRALFAVALGRDAGDISDGDDFFQCGGTSLDYLAMLSQLQSDLGVSLSTDSQSLRTVGELCRHIEAVRQDDA